jgi:hypothetical protein
MAEWSRLSAFEWTVDYGSYAPLIEQRAGAQRRQKGKLDEEWADANEDQKLYHWPYLHSDERY